MFLNDDLWFREFPDRFLNGVEDPLFITGPERRQQDAFRAVSGQTVDDHVFRDEREQSAQEAIAAIQRCVRIAGQPVPPCKLIHAFVSSESVERL